MKKGEIYEGVVERIDFPNKGRVHVEGEWKDSLSLCDFYNSSLFNDI